MITAVDRPRGADRALEKLDELEERGRRKGRIQAAREAIVIVLEARGIEVPFFVRQRIWTCGSLGLLETWLIRAITATSAGAVIGND